MRRPVSVVLVLLLLAAVSISASDSSSSFDGVVRAVMTEHRLPSLSVAVASGGKIVYAAAHGFADLENGVPASPRTVYPLGSVTKTVTAAAALRLVEQGHLDLDLPVNRYCVAFPREQPEITARQLLSHLGGIRHYDYRRFDEDFLNTKRYRSIEEALSKFAADPLVAEPGAKYHYSSWGYVLLGCVLEGAAASSYAGIIEKRMKRIIVAAALILAPTGAAEAQQLTRYLQQESEFQGVAGTYVGSPDPGEIGTGDVAVDADSVAGPAASIADLGWLVGHWRGEALGGVAEEIWLDPAGGTMAGMFRLIQNDRVVLYELFTISEPDLVLRLKHFNADLSGWEERNEVVTFPLVRLGPAEAVFDGLRFRLLPDGRLHAAVQTRQRDGTEEQIDFVLEKHPNGSGPPAVPAEE